MLQQIHFLGQIAALLLARNPHVVKYIPVDARGAPCTSPKKMNFQQHQR
jgi:hypothetical protein